MIFTSLVIAVNNLPLFVKFDNFQLKFVVLFDYTQLYWNRDLCCCFFWLNKLSLGSNKMTKRQANLIMLHIEMQISDFYWNVKKPHFVCHLYDYMVS